MPSWMPGDDYYTDFHKGDPYIKVDQGFARLPGKGYEALHPELEGINPEDYPDINKMAILADVAPYSREYNTRSRRPARQQKLRAGAGERAAGFQVSVVSLALERVCWLPVHPAEPCPFCEGRSYLAILYRRGSGKRISRN